jgi:T5SS/PEP-CTERM-associated repeat protein
MSSATINTLRDRSNWSMLVSRWSLGVATCLTVLSFVATGNAQTAWTNSSGGFWHTGSNWLGGSPPAPADNALFNLPNTSYNVLWNNGFGDSTNLGLVVGPGSVTFSNASASIRTHSVTTNSVITGTGAVLTVGSFPGNIMQLTSGGVAVDSGGQLVATSGSKVSTPGQLSVGNGSLTAQAGGIIDASVARIGDGGSGSALVTGAGSQMNIGAQFGEGMSVGFGGGTGLLNIQNGGVVSPSSTTSYIGSAAGSTGTVNVTGAGSRLVLDSVWQDDLAIGGGVSGLLNILDGGFVTNRQSFVDASPGGTATVTVSGAGSTWQMDSLRMFRGSVNIQAGGQATMSSGGTIGESGPGTSTVTVSDAGSQLNGGVTVGFHSTGVLNVLAGGNVTGSASSIGFGDGANGTATVGGSGSVWNISSRLLLGYNDGDLDTQGTLTVHSGGLVTSGSGILGFDYVGAGSATGMATVTGAGSRWNITNELHVGEMGVEGTGRLNVEAGGVVANVEGILGFEAGSSGFVTVTGAGSQWNNSFYTTVGYRGQGSLLVESGGIVRDTDSNIGLFAGASGVARVTGPGSQWIHSSYLAVGSSGQGTLNVENGGVVSNTDSIIAAAAGSTGAATVTGSGSQWNSSSYLLVGNQGNGTLNVTAGGVVNNSIGSVGQLSGAEGDAIVTGSGSQWNNSAHLIVGNAGLGGLSVTAGGLVANTQGFIGNEVDSLGVVIVTDVGSRWTNSAKLTVGNTGAGRLDILAGGEVTNKDADIGLAATSPATVNVTGAGSKWTNSGYLITGSSGNGTLNVLSAGTVSNTDAVLGYVSGGSGSALITGANSKWTNSGFLVVGNSGGGTLNVEAGGAVSNTDAVVGQQVGGTGTATVTGAGSTWMSSGFLAVGESGVGTLNVTAGGVVSNAGTGHLGIAAGSSGVVTVTGSGSQWNIMDNLEVGRFGAGTLNIADGGSVSVVNNTVVNADGQFNNSNGSFVSNTVINQVGGEILGQGQFSAPGGWSNSGFMAFRTGTSHIYGTVNNLAGGRIFSEFFNTAYFHGDVVHNGAQIAVGAGSTIQFLGSVTGAGNYFSGGLVVMNSAFRPGNGAGAVSFARDLTLSAGNTIFMELGGIAPGAFDQVLVGNNLTLGGTLDVSLLSGFVPTAGATFNLFDWASVSGTFAALSLPALGGGLSWNTSQLYTTGVLSVDGVSGDFDHDGDVDGADLLVWQRGGSPTPNSSADLAVWKTNFGFGAATPAASAVPEPGSQPLIVSMLAMLFAYRREWRFRSFD